LSNFKGPPKDIEEDEVVARAKDALASWLAAVAEDGNAEQLLIATLDAEDSLVAFREWLETR